MAHLKFSIIIPVFNSERHLEGCVKSIQEQTYKELEIILVDDGSTDGSAKLCDELASKDSRIVVIHKQNGGTSSARNAGIEASSGDYLTFMDNDDYWDGTDSLANIASYLEESNADVLMHDSFIYWQDTNEIIAPKNTAVRTEVVNKSAGDALAHLINANIFSLYCVWSKVIKASVIKENHVHFPNGMRNEDTYFCGELFIHTKSYDFYEKPFYVYRKGHTGAQTQAGMKYQLVADLQKICIDYESKVRNTIKDASLLNSLLSFIAFPYSVWMGQSKMVKDIRIKEDTRIMKQHKGLLKYSLHPNVKLVRKVCSLVGFGLTSRLLSIYIKKNNHLG